MAENVLLEVGLEELPARYVDDAQKQLKEKTAAWLDELRIAYQSITSYSTPRRLAIIIHGIDEMQATIEEEVRGPALNIAKDSEGEWSKAAIGFARGQGKTVDDLVEKEVKGKSYVFVTKRIEGQPVKDILPGLKEIIESISFGKNMRWGTKTLRFARPIRWLVALYGGEVIPFEIAGVKAGNKTYGHRYLGSETVIDNELEYEETLKNNFVIVDPMKREEMIVKGIKNIEKNKDCQIIVERDLLDEVRNLVEYPTVFFGSFEEEFLNLPAEVLIISMKEHQRYFPVTNHEGKLLPHFIGVRNGDEYALETVIRGNEKVLRARLADAEFFYEEDQKNSIDFYLDKISRVVFQEKLGTLAEKVERVKYIADKIADKLELESDTKALALRAAEISKFDLTTNMVNEFPELQGVIGEIYAKNFGENKEVASAIREQYLPKQAQGELPQTEIGALLSVAEKIDTIAGIIIVGLIPTGSQDPYGLRRQAAGVMRILEDKNWDITLESILQIAKELYQKLEIEKVSDHDEKIHDFFQLRAAFLMKEIGIEQDIIQSVLVNKIGHFKYAVQKAKLLSEKRQEHSFKEKEEALVRILNLADKAGNANIQPDLFETDSEKALYERFMQSKKAFYQFDKAHQADEAFEQLEVLASPIHHFFDNNMVMADDAEIRNNRLSLVFEIAELVKDFADLSLIEWKQSF